MMNSNFRFGKWWYNGRTDGADGADENGFFFYLNVRILSKKSKKIRFHLPNPPHLFSHYTAFYYFFITFSTIATANNEQPF